MEERINIFGKIAMLDRVYSMRQGYLAAVYVPHFSEATKSILMMGATKLTELHGGYTL